MKIGDIVIFNNQEYTVMRFQPEGIRLKGTKNNPLGGERFEIVLDDEESKDITLINSVLKEKKLFE